MAELPTNIEASYGDRSAGDRVHQQHHDQIHAFVNSAGAPDGVATLDADGLLPETQVPDRLTEPALSATFGHSGTGSPEGVIAAPVGSRYTDKAATNGAVLWVKATGTGATGWRVVYGATGVRDVSSGLMNGWTATLNGVKIARVGNLVDLVIEVNNATSTTQQVLTLPPGFRPALGSSAFYAAVGGRLDIHSAIGSVTPVAAAEGLRGRFTFGTADPWPTTLPGTAV